MPKIIAGKRKNGLPKEFKIPGEVLDSRGRTIYKEWEVKNRFRDSLGINLSTRKNKNPSGILYDSKGKVINDSIKTTFSKREVLKLLASSRRKQRKVKFMDMLMADANEVLFKIETMGPGDEKIAYGMICANSFFKASMFRGKLKIYPKMNISQLKDACADCFLDEYMLRLNSVKKSFSKGASKIAKDQNQVSLK